MNPRTIAILIRDPEQIAHNLATIAHLCQSGAGVRIFMIGQHPRMSQIKTIRGFEQHPGADIEWFTNMPVSSGWSGFQPLDSRAIAKRIRKAEMVMAL